MKKRMLILIALLAVAVAAVCLLRRKTPQVPTAIRHGVRPVQTKGVAVPSASRAAQPRTAVDSEDVSVAVAVVCGHEAATADRYEARNAALRSLSRRRDLGVDDVQALMDYLRATDGALRVEREAALKVSARS